MEFEFGNCFPFPEIREQQRIAIEFALNAFLVKNKKFVILELGTGVGKSACAIAVARYLDRNEPGLDGFNPGSLFLTTQKILQEQYVADFGPPRGQLASIKSSENYTCGFMKKNTCAESSRTIQFQKGTPFFHACMNNCKYKQDKKLFLESKESITNFSYFFAESKYAGKIVPRELLVVDEAHNIELELGKFIEITFSERFSKHVLKIHWPEQSSDAAALRWVVDVYKPKLETHIKHIKSMLEKYAGLKSKLDELSSFSKQHSMLDKHLCKVNRFLDIYEEDNWALNVVEGNDSTGSMRKFEFKPIDVSIYSDEYLFKYGRHVMLMSATILDRDAYCKLLGIPIEQVEFLSIESPFPVENRPVFYVPAGKMGKDNITATLPNLAKIVSSLLEQHKGEKGVVHCHTFQIANYLKQNIRSNRLLIHDSMNKDRILQKHYSSKKPTVLLSPSSTEGLDLKDDLSRFQIICKLPYPFLGDKLVRKRMRKYDWWYPYQTSKTILQSLGRSIRDVDDHAVSYILDQNWERFFSDHGALFPGWFVRALQ